MLSVKPVRGTNIIEVEIDGPITPDDYEQAIGQVESAIKERGKLRVLKRVKQVHMPPIPWSKFWEDFEFGIKHMGDFTHAAVVTDHDWVRTFAKACSPVLKMKVRVFEPADEAEAWKWLREEA